MRFEIPFNEKISREQSVFLFNMHWKEALKKNKNSLYIGVAITLLGALIIYGKNNIGFLFIGIGAYLLLNFINHRRFYNQNKKIYFKTVDDNISGRLSQKSFAVWEFLEDNFCYSNYKFDLKIKWETIKTFKVINDYIILELRDSIACNFILEKEEVGIEDFEKIIVFMESKIKKNGVL
ncbi:hypothetical protein [Flavobacterium reichenbachii]|uniref:YcxB-like protein domain-containing protein n=1 Tax=Flavobacterium reichenbachii TaxID=362418 RepID=A0A085ZSS9_9FLAO|nr:hypothetical protein [Flavobacterium reichenbachii]KFF07493.1 hypothetical protein IW19_19155 [Flavobacterium reichenbachii]OXB14135.1 hypothetical protein B0A68_12985 [Flavobacterium reichenbachii]